MSIKFSKPQLTSLFILILLFLIAFIPRIYHLSDTEIYPDEVSWTVRSKEVFNNIRGGNFSYFEDAWWNEKEGAVAIGIPLTALGGLSLRFFGQTVSYHSFKLLSDIDAVRLPVVILSSLFIAAFYYYLKKIIDSKVAFVVALFLALDPIMLALSRWALNDMLLTVFGSLSLISFITNIKEKKVTICPGLFLALAFLSKPNGIVIVAGWIVLTLLNRQKNGIRLFVVNTLVFLVSIYLFWPSMHTNPFYIFDYFLRQTQFVTQTNLNFYFLGTVTNNPPFYYYLFQIATRIPLAIIFGLLLSFLLLIINLIHIKNIKEVLFKNSAWLAIIIYTICSYCVIGIASKKLGARYALPLWPWIYLASVLAWYKILKPFNKIIFATFVIITTFSFVYIINSYNPHYYFYYNNLIGGSQNAQNYDLPNLCLGAKSVSKFVNIQPEVNKITYLGCGKSIFPYYSNKQTTNNLKDQSDLIVVEDSFQRLLPNEDYIKDFNTQVPLAVISEKGIILAKIYAKD